jgi:hypothetical protein
MIRIRKWAHRKAFWRLANSTFTSERGWTRSEYHSRLPIPTVVVRRLAQWTADQDNRQAFVGAVTQQPRYRGLRTWEIRYQ